MIDGLLNATPGWIRWVLVLPAGLVTWVAFGNLILWLPTLGESADEQRDSDPLARIARIGLALLTPLAIIYVTTRIAPIRHIFVAGATGIVWALYVCVAFAVSVQRDGYNSSADWLEWAAVVVFAIVGFVVAFAFVHREQPAGVKV